MGLAARRRRNPPFKRRVTAALAVTLLVIPMLISLDMGAQAQATEKRCVSTNQIHQTKRSADGTFIDFRMTGSTVYRNTLRQRCSGLTRNGFTYRTTNGSLCSGNTIRVLKSGGSCTLGPFVDITPR
jgi:hypothetical protein